MAKIWLIGGGGISAAFLLAVLATQFVTQRGIEDALRAQQAKALVERIGDQLDAVEGNLRGRLATIASDAELTAVLAQGNLDLLPLYERELAKRVSGLLGLRIIPTGRAKVEPGGRFPFSYAAIDLVNRSEAWEESPPEAIPVGTDWLITLAHPVTLGGKYLGTLYAYFAPEVIKELLRFEDSQGVVTLYQQFPGVAARKILSFGSAAGGGSPVQQPLRVAHWTVEVIPAEIQSGTQVSLVAIWLPVTLLYLGALAAGAVSLLALLRLVHNEGRLLEQQIRRVSERSHKLSANITLPALARVDVVLQSLQARPPVPAEKPGPAAIRETAAKGPTPPIDIEMLDEEAGDFAEIELGDPGDPDAVTDSRVDLSSIFRAYDIRGVVDETLTPESVLDIGRSIGSYALSQGERKILVGMDGRVSGPMVSESLVAGLLATGVDVVHLGMVPTPVVYFGTHTLGVASAVIITASHNPPEYNGFKIVIRGKTLAADELAELLRIYNEQDFDQGAGELTHREILSDYKDAICEDVVVAQPLMVMIDCGNGVTGVLAAELFTDLGCDVVALHAEVDGSFPNHDPDPSVPANLSDLIQAVTANQADLGIAFDGDGDRMVAVTNTGTIVWPDRMLMLLTKDIVSRNPGADVVYDIKCTRHLNSVISNFGGRPIVCRSGHSYLKAKMEETGALLGGELSGHICIKERWFGFDDGIYGAARLLEIVGAQTRTLEELMNDFPKSVATPEIKVPVPDHVKFGFMHRLSQVADFQDGSVSDLDGIRVDFPRGWGLVRASNTMPALTLRFEAENDTELKRIKSIFKTQMLAIDKSLQLDF